MATKDNKSDVIRQKFTTPPGTAVYPRLDAPDTKFDPDGKYSVKLRWPADVIHPLQERVEKLIDERHAALVAEDKRKAKEATIRSPFKEVLDDDGEPTGEIEATFSMKAIIRRKDGTVRTQRPVLADARGRPSRANPWSGSTLAVFFEASADYWTGQKVVGASLNLKGAQIIKLVKGSGNEDISEMGFSTYDDGFVDEEDYSAATGDDVDGDDIPAKVVKTDDDDDDSGDF